MNLKQHRFVTEYLRHRDAMTAYSIAYNYETSNYTSLQSAANRLMNHPEVAAAIHSILDGIRHDVEQEIRAELKVELLSVQYKRELLAKIATGQAYAVHNYKGKDCNVCTQFVYPTINQMLKAIDLDSKLAGHYPVKQSAADNRQFTVPALEKTSIGQQLSEAVSLRPLKETSKSQQNTTELSPAGGGVRRTGVEHSRRIENTTYHNNLQNKTPSLQSEKGPQNINPGSLSYQEEGRGETSNSAYPPYQQGSPTRQTAQT